MKQRLLLIIGMFFWWSVSALADDVIRLGVLAKRGPERCRERWGATAEYLSEHVGSATFELVPLGFSDIYSAVENRAVDFLLVNPSFYVGLESQLGVNRIATLETLRGGHVCTVFGGVIFVRADRADIQALRDIRGHTVMAVEETSFGGWQTAYRLLKENRLEPNKDFRLSFAGTHDGVVHAVLEGQVDVGTVRTDTLEHMAREETIDLNDFRVLHPQDYPPAVFPFLCSTQLYPEWPFAKAAHVSDELGEKVAIALMEMQSDDLAAQTAHIEGWSPPLNYQSVHDCLKEIRMGPYENYGRVSMKTVLQKYWPWLFGVMVFIAVLTGMMLYVAAINKKMQAAGDLLTLELYEREKAERNMRQIFDTAGDGMRVLLADHSIHEVNRQFCEMLGYQRDELIGMDCRTISSCVDVCDTPSCSLAVALEKEGRVERDVEVLCRDGQKLPCILTSVPYYDAEGRVIGAIQNFKDIRDRLVAETAEKQQAVQMSKIEMASGVLHDIGNAVTGIGTAAVSCLNERHWPELDSLKRLEDLFQKEHVHVEEAFGKGKAEKLVSFVQKLSESLTGRKTVLDKKFQKMYQAILHINDILALQRRYAGTTQAGVRQSVDVKGVLRDALSMLEASMEKRQIRVSLRESESACLVRGDRTHLVQVIMNVLKNVCEAFDEQGERQADPTLVISLGHADKRVLLSFADNGPGFDEETGRRIFDKGFTTKKRDSGIGLYQCRSIIETHQGTMTIESPGVDAGAVVKIDLPKEEKADESGKI